MVKHTKIFNKISTLSENLKIIISFMNHRAYTNCRALVIMTVEIGQIVQKNDIALQLCILHITSIVLNDVIDILFCVGITIFMVSCSNPGEHFLSLIYYRHMIKI